MQAVQPIQGVPFERSRYSEAKVRDLKRAGFYTDIGTERYAVNEYESENGPDDSTFKIAVISGAGFEDAINGLQHLKEFFVTFTTITDERFDTIMERLRMTNMNVSRAVDKIKDGRETIHFDLLRTISLDNADILNSNSEIDITLKGEHFLDNVKVYL